MALALGIFWVASALLLWVYAGYPLVAWLYGKLRPLRVASDGTWPALVTVGIAVHDGAPQIEERIANVISQTPPFALEIVVASDGSSDETVAAVARLGALDERIRVLDLPRGGQAAAQAAIFESAQGEVVVLTDVETRFAAHCLAALVERFSDRRVGCVTGILHWQYDELTDTASHESLYWRYEQAVRAWESRAGWLTAATGALLAVRRTQYRPVPLHASLDQLVPLVARADGKLVLVEPRALAADRGTSVRSEQFRARVRIATQGIEANLRMAARIVPWRRPGSFLAIWSHKLLRWATPFFWLAALTGATYLWLLGDQVVYALPIALSALVVLAALAGLLAQRSGRRVALTGLPLTIISINAAFALGWLNVLSRRRMGAWETDPHLNH